MSDCDVTDSARKPSAADRARKSLGISDEAIYSTVRSELVRECVHRGTILDVGCGEGDLKPWVDDLADRYVGSDIVRYERFPADADFLETNLETGRIAVDDCSIDTVVAAEVIEHLENPRAFVRELARCTRPGGLVVVTTPNQLSALSLAVLALRRRHAAFQDVHYPAHLTALLEVDLVRIANEAGLVNARIAYTCTGRIVFTPWHYPRALASRFPRWLSDNVVLLARRPD